MSILIAIVVLLLLLPLLIVGAVFGMLGSSRYHRPKNEAEARMKKWRE